VDAAATGWDDAERVDRYLERVDGLAPRQAGEDVLRSLLPKAPRTLLDLGCGDGRLAALALEARPGLERVVAVDNSPAMLDKARLRFAGDRRVTVHHHDLARTLEGFGTFDVIISGSAIHHLEDRRKQSLFAEVTASLRPGGLFANLEVVASATPELHAEFLDLIGRPADDPEDRLTDVGSQLQWMDQAGLVQVDCLWRWRGFALLAGRARTDHDPVDAVRTRAAAGGVESGCH
jgi:cyclopropane fatty-acyl-phospholipid synthase-like methyltransferase